MRSALDDGRAAGTTSATDSELNAKKKKKKIHIPIVFFFLLLLLFPSSYYIFLLSKELHKCLFKLRAGFSLVCLVY